MENTPLKKYNTFNIDVKSKYFYKVKNREELLKILEKHKDEKRLILGEGSNILLLNDWDGVTIKIEIMGVELMGEDDEYAYIIVHSGEIWDEFVKYSVENNFAGIENLVMIPGTVGGAVRENIGAYGQNISDSIYSVEVINTKTLKTEVMGKDECGYRYRNSNFKKKWKNKYIIIAASFKLKKNTKEFELSYHERAGRYGSLKEELESFAKEPYNIQDVMQAVIKQRTKRLPSVEEYGTCGSFFKNPLVTFRKYKELSKQIEGLQYYPAEDLKYDVSDLTKLKDDDYVKIPAGRLLDELGWKGKKEGNVGVFEKHALCVVTNKKATGKEVYNFIKAMQQDISKKYGVSLDPEVNIIKK